MIIRAPLAMDEAGIRAAHAELAADGFEFALGLDDATSFACWLETTADWAAGRNLPDGWVPAQFLVAVDDAGEVLGRVSIRFELHGWLKEIGGHVGYGVRPGARRRGVATALLRRGLDVLGEAGVDEALVTCDVDNTGSRRTIERCDGRFKDIVESPNLPDKRRYLVPTQKDGDVR